MSSKHLDYFIHLVVILLFHRNVNLSMCSEEAASISRSLDLSIPAWRPLVQNPYHHQYYQNTAATPAHLISYSHLDGTNKEEIIEAAKYNAQALRKYNELSQQPITSYNNPYPLYTQTPGPLTKVVSTTAFINPNILRQQPLVSASNLIHARLPYPGKSASLYSTKLNFLGKPEMAHHHIAHLHQNGIHQTIATTPKIAGYTKEQSGRVNFHYHHPSFGMTPIFDSTTKRIPMFGSSVTPHSTTKVHPVMSRFQAHMALAAMSQNQQSNNNNNNNNNKLKQRPNLGSSQEFSPPSQIVSNYANYETATRLPLWHHGFSTKSHGSAHGGDFHHHVHKPEAQKQILPSVHPSIITPFLEQVHLKQKEVAAAAEQKNSFKHSHESSSIESNASFEVINDIFSKHLVPPPPSTSKAYYKTHKTEENVEKYPKLNLAMQSPLQDASRFNYNNVISTTAPSSTTSSSTASPHRNNLDIPKYRPSYSENIHTVVTEKPNVFVNLNRTKENPYKHHKLLHPSYTGVFKKKPSFNQDKPFLPTPYKPLEKEEEIKIDYEPQHSYFTIEDAVTPNFPDSLKYDHHEGSDELEIITLRPQVKPTKDYSATTPQSTQISSSTTAFIESTAVESPTASSSPKPRQKLRRRKPKPQNQQVFQEQQQVNEDHQQEIANEKPSRIRGNERNSTPAPDTELRTRNRLNHSNRVRTKPNLTSTPAAITSSEYDYTVKPFENDVRRSEITTTQTTSEGTSSKSIESSEQKDVSIRHRVRFRYKNKLNAKTNSLEGIDYNQKLKDSQISDSENENVIVKQPSMEETTEFNVVTENPFNEIKSSLKLPNLKLRNEVFTTNPTIAETVSTPGPSSITVENENNALQKAVSRPRFSIKELKRKQFLTSSSTAISSTTSILTSSTFSTTVRPDNNRFIRYRLNLNRRRNDTSDSTSSEEVDSTRKRYSGSRFSSSPISTTSTTIIESTVHSSTKRPNLPKRTFATRNFTKPSPNINENETQSPKPFIRNSTFVSNRPSTPSLRQRIQNYKKKTDASNEVVAEQDDTIKNSNFDTIITRQEVPSTTSSTPTSTDLPMTRETSIMKIAKTPSSVINNAIIKATTINNNFDDQNTLPSYQSGVDRLDTTDLDGSPSEHSQRVAELTISANEDSSFKSANIGLLSRRIPNYFTISTDDPILPIQAFFPQIKTNEGN